MDKKELQLIKDTFPDCQIIQSDADYEYCHVIVDGVRMVFYPHKTSANNYHTRIRNGTPNRANDFMGLAIVLNKAKGRFDCTFSVKNKGSMEIKEVPEKYRKYLTTITEE